jgi:hypothetical protein
LFSSPRLQLIYFTSFLSLVREAVTSLDKHLKLFVSTVTGGWLITVLPKWQVLTFLRNAVLSPNSRSLSP